MVFAGNLRKRGGAERYLPGGVRRREGCVGAVEGGGDAARCRGFLAGGRVAAASSGDARSSAQKPARQHHKDARAQHEGEGTIQRARGGLPSPESRGDGGGCGVSGGRLGRPGGEIGVVEVGKWKRVDRGLKRRGSRGL